MKTIFLFIVALMTASNTFCQDTITFTAKWVRTDYPKVIAFYGIKDYDENGVGLATYYHKDGTLHSHQMEKNDLKHGHCIWYHKNGEKKAEGDYIDDLPEGRYQFYHDDGELWRTDVYKNGEISDEQTPPPPAFYKEVEIVDVDPTDENYIVDFPDVYAEFPGGQDSMSAFLVRNMEYPMEAIINDEQGTVYLAFIVNIDGSISNIKVERSATHALDSAAIDVISNMPKWSPGLLNDKPCRTRCRIPIVFSLNEGTEEEEPQKKRRSRRR